MNRLNAFLLVAALVSMVSPLASLSCSTHKQAPRPQAEPAKLSGEKRPTMRAVKRPGMRAVKRPVMRVVKRPITKKAPSVPVKFADIVAKGSRLPIASIKKVKALHVDGRVFAYVGWLRHQGKDLIALVPPDGSPSASRRFTQAYDVRPRMLIDLAKPGRLRPNFVFWRSTNTRTRGMQKPTLVLRISYKRVHKKSPTPSTSKGIQGLGHTQRGGTESWQDLLFVPVRALWRTTLLLTVGRRSADGFGGHRISNLRIEHKGGKTILKGTRQDDLPARRARCLAPPPHPVLYELRNHTFRKIHAKRTRPGCR